MFAGLWGRKIVINSYIICRKRLKAINNTDYELRISKRRKGPGTKKAQMSNRENTVQYHLKFPVFFRIIHRDREVSCALTSREEGRGKEDFWELIFLWCPLTADSGRNLGPKKKRRNRIRLGLC